MEMALGGLLLAGKPSGVEVTIYNQGFGLVKEARVLSLRAGRQSIAVEDVAAQIDPTSVGVRGAGFQLLEQNYQFDLISPAAILAKSVGQRVRLIRTVGNQRDVLEGTLMSSPTAVVGGQEGASMQYNGVVIRTDNGRIVLDPVGEIEVTTIPPGLISKPTLLWDLEASRAGDVPVELSYITGGVSWNCDYVFTLDGAEKGDFQGWVTVNNQSGATWENAKLKLLAGDVERVQDRRQFMRGMEAMAMGAPAAKEQFQQESLFEYYLYTLQRPATVRNKEIKQISLMDKRGVPFRKKLVVDAMQSMPRMIPNEGEVGTGDVKPQVRVEFTNDEKSGLGVPLPQGKVRVYQRDQSGSTQFLGEDQIGHTPKDEKLSLVVGRSFDVVANRKRTNFDRISDRVIRESYEIELRNRKDVAETIHVIERAFGEWRILAKSHEFTKLNSDAFEFVVTVPANTVAKVTYTIETRW